MKYEMDKACSTHGRDKKCIHSLSEKNIQRRNHFEDIGADGRIILKRETISSHCDDCIVTPSSLTDRYRCLGGK